MKNFFIIIYLLTVAICTYSQPSFPGAFGFGAEASGGRGGKVIYVTNLNVSGPGSLQDALNQAGPRYILFKVSGVIPATIKVPNGNGDFTIAGQTSPSGITVRGMEMYNEENVSVSNVIIRHLRSRIGDRSRYPSPYWIAEDGITLGGVHNAVIDHCSFAHASDEAADISRSSKITIQNCILGETLGSHADLGGMLINYSSVQSRLDSLSIIYNVWNRIGGRMPEISCETPYCNGKTIHVELSNNLFWDPKIELWYEGRTGFNGNFYLKMNAVNNLFYAGPQYGNGMFHFDLLNFQQNQLFFAGNRLNLYYPQHSDYQLFYCCNDFNLHHPNSDFGSAQKLPMRFNFPPLFYHPVEQLPDFISENAGAFPRDSMDRRFMSYLKEKIIPNIPVSIAAADDAFLLNEQKEGPADTDLDGMPDYWEIYHGLNPADQDHNLKNLSPEITGISGYTNLECYLNCLSDALISGQSTPECGINLSSSKTENDVEKNNIWSISPNPATNILTVYISDLSIQVKNIEVLITDWTGKIIHKRPIDCCTYDIDLTGWNAGIYFAELRLAEHKNAMSKRRFVIAK